MERRGNNRALMRYSILLKTMVLTLTKHAEINLYQLARRMKVSLRWR